MWANRLYSDSVCITGEQILGGESTVQSNESDSQSDGILSTFGSLHGCMLPTPHQTTCGKDAFHENIHLIL